MIPTATKAPDKREVGSSSLPRSFLPRLRALTGEVDPSAIIVRPAVLNRVFDDNWYLMWIVIWGGGLLSGVLLWLAVSSIYALMSFAVGERTREIGIRTALGAERRSIALAVALRSLTQLGLGVLLGMPMARWMFLTTAADQGNAASAYSASVFVLVLGTGLMVLIGTLACVAPTLRALRITPTEALREGG